MAKPRHTYNRLEKPEEPGDGAAEGGGEIGAVGKEEEGGWGKQGEEAEDHPPLVEELTGSWRAMRPVRVENRRRRRRKRKDTRRKGIGTERLVWSLVWGGTPPPPEDNVELPGF